MFMISIYFLPDYPKVYWATGDFTIVQPISALMF
jgi:hypothetical protein